MTKRRNDSPRYTDHTCDVAGGVSVEHITSNAEFDALENDWNALFDASSTAGLFNRYNWNRLWWEYYGGNAKLHIIVVRVAGKVKAIAPMYRSTTVFLRICKINTLRFIGTGGDTSPDDLDVLCVDDMKEQVIGLIYDDLLQDGHAGCIQLNDVASDSVLAHVINSKAQQHRWYSSIYRVQKRLVDTLPASVGEFEKNLSRNARKQRKRRRQQLYAAGDAQFEFCRTPDEVNKALDELTRLHTLRHASKGSSGSFHSSTYCDFHRKVMLSALKRDRLRLLVLRLDGKTVGVEYAFLCNGVLSFFQTGFDPEYQHLSPGHLLMMHIIDHAINEGATHIDLLKGRYEYKSTYAKQICTTVDLELWRSRAAHVVKSLIRTIRARTMQA